MTTEETIAQQIAVTVTPLDPTKCYFIVIRADEYMTMQQLYHLREALSVSGIKCVVAQLPPSVEVECIEQEAPQGPSLVEVQLPGLDAEFIRNFPISDMMRDRQREAQQEAP